MTNSTKTIVHEFHVVQMRVKHLCWQFSPGDGLMCPPPPRPIILQSAGVTRGELECDVCLPSPWIGCIHESRVNVSYGLSVLYVRGTARMNFLSGVSPKQARHAKTEGNEMVTFESCRRDLSHRRIALCFVCRESAWKCFFLARYMVPCAVTWV